MKKKKLDESDAFDVFFNKFCELMNSQPDNAGFHTYMIFNLTASKLYDGVGPEKFLSILAEMIALKVGLPGTCEEHKKSKKSPKR